MIRRSPRKRWWSVGLLGLAVLTLSALSVSLGTRPVQGQASASTVLIAQNATLGPMLTDPQGMTLYRRMNDPQDGSSCTGGCATTWPPLLASGGSLAVPSGAMGTLATFARDDGSLQVTYNDMALYYFSGDKAPGDTNGQGLNNNWFVVTP